MNKARNLIDIADRHQHFKINLPAFCIVSQDNQMCIRKAAVTKPWVEAMETSVQYLEIIVTIVSIQKNKEIVGINIFP